MTGQRAAKQTRPQTLSNLVNRRGFTFVEMSVVVSLIALLATAILPRILAVQKSQTDTAFRVGLARLVQVARNEAVARKTTVELAIDGNQIGWQIPEDSATGTESSEEATGLQGAISLPEGGELADFQLAFEDVEEDEWSVGFYPDGTSDEAAIAFTLAGREWLLRIDGETGTGRVTTGTIDDVADDSWEAGDLEQRGG